MKIPLSIALALLPTIIFSGAANAQIASPSMPSATPVPLPTPDLRGEIPLGTSSGKDKEQWETVFGLRGVRNVSRATIMPFLPSKAKATGAAVIVAPGGGFRYLSIDSEGYEVARWLADHGVAAFVLKYRPLPTPRPPAEFGDSLMAMLRGLIASPSVGESTPEAPLIPPPALEDAHAALKLVRERAGEWGIDPQRVGFMGFSAGAVLTLGVGLDEDPAQRPDFIAPIYGLMNARPVPADAPPMFVAVSLDDPIMAKGDLGLINAWRNAHRPVEVHLYERGGHGWGMTGKYGSPALWIDSFLAWMSDRGLLKASS